MAKLTLLLALGSALACADAWPYFGDRPGGPVHPCHGGTAAPPAKCSISPEHGGVIGTKECRTWSYRCEADGGLTAETVRSMCIEGCFDDCPGPDEECFRGCVSRRCR